MSHNIFKIKKQYTGYQRHILAEVMQEDELRALDRMYTQAKKIRIKRFAKIA